MQLFLDRHREYFTNWKAFILEDTIGEGRSGTVYKITDKKGNYCTLKVIPVTLEDGINPLSFKNRMHFWDFHRKTPTSPLPCGIPDKRPVQE